MTHPTTRGRVKVAGLQPAQVLAGLVGVFFLVAGVAGFVRTGFADFDRHEVLLGLTVNPLHNVVHLAFGVLGLLMATGSGLSRLYGWILFVAYGVVLVWGLMLVGVVAVNPVARLGDPLALDVRANWLHLGFTALGLLIAVLPARHRIVVPEETVVAPPRDESIREPHVPDPRVETPDPTVTTRPTRPIDPAVAERHQARHAR